MNCLLDDGTPEEVHDGLLRLELETLRETADTLQAAMLCIGRQCDTTIDTGLPPSLVLAVKKALRGCVEASRKLGNL